MSPTHVSRYEHRTLAAPTARWLAPTLSALLAVLIIASCQSASAMPSTGGGTGGHVGPALAVIAELQRRRPDTALEYVGSATGIEARLARETGVEFVGVATGKLRRSSKGVRGLFTIANLRDLTHIPTGVVQAHRAVRRFGPDAVLATGGYVCIPAVVAAWLRRVPVLAHEQTVTIGLANRIAARFARCIAVTFEGSIEDLPARLRRKAFVTGNPVRSAIFDGDRATAVERFGLYPPDAALPCLVVMGGVQGARVVNHAVRDAIPRLVERYRVLHQCGSADAEELLALHATLPETQRRRWIVRPFVDSDEIGDWYATADLLVGRAGAGTVAEACALGLAAVYVPLEPTSGDEQLRNAGRSVQAGAAAIVRQADLSADTLIAAIDHLFEPPGGQPRRRAMADAARTLATPNATADLTDALLALADG